MHTTRCATHRVTTSRMPPVVSMGCGSLCSAGGMSCVSSGASIDWSRLGSRAAPTCVCIWVIERVRMNEGMDAMPLPPAWLFNVLISLSATDWN